MSRTILNKEGSKDIIDEYTPVDCAYALNTHSGSQEKEHH